MIFVAAPKKKVTKKKKVDFLLTAGILDNTIRLFFSENSLIDRKIFSKVDAVFGRADLEKYEDDLEMYLRINIIERLLDLRYEQNVSNTDLLEAQCFDGEYEEERREILELIYEQEMSNEDVKYVDNWLSEHITYSNLFEYLPMLRDLCHELEAGSTSITRINEKAKGVIDAFNTSIKVAKSVIDASANDFTSRKSEAFSATDKAIKRKKDSVCLKTATKELNNTLNGGFYNARLYLFCAAPKRGKSTTLLNLALQTKHANKGFKAKDPTKRPAIVYLTQENTVHETIERMWSYYFGEDALSEISDYTTEEAIDKLNEAGFINDDEDDDGVVFVVKYRKNKTLNANDIKDICDGMAEDGLECVGLFHDYLKRLKAINKGSDDRIEFGNISNELSDLCKELDIPIITAMQLNRSAIQIIENKALNAGNNLGSSLISESALVIENVDAVFIINLTKTKDNKFYMFFKLTEPRYKVPEDALWDFYQPFEHGMRMIEDWDSAQSMALPTLSTDLVDGNGDDIATPASIRKNNSSGKKKPVIPKLNLVDDEQELFDLDELSDE